MLRFRFKELLADMAFREGRVITILEVAQATNIHRMTLSKIANHRGYNPTADVLDKLCTYFQCRIEQLVEHVSDEEAEHPRLKQPPTSITARRSSKK
jgi:putative transcriptional regulator